MLFIFGKKFSILAGSGTLGINPEKFLKQLARSSVCGTHNISDIEGNIHTVNFLLKKSMIENLNITVHIALCGCEAWSLTL
jgi:hypothetical protein